VYIKQGMDFLSGMSRREQRTLEIITSCKPNSRLACQSRVLQDGVVVELPPGMYVKSLQDIEALIGRRAQTDMLHPVTGEVLVESGKLIARSTIKQLENTDFQIGSYMTKTTDA